MRTDKLYEKNGCVGFEARKDGYWFIQENGDRISMSDEEGKRILMWLRATFINRQTPKWATMAEYAVSSIRHRAAKAAYEVTRFFAGERR